MSDPRWRPRSRRTSSRAFRAAAGSARRRGARRRARSEPARPPRRTGRAHGRDDTGRTNGRDDRGALDGQAEAGRVREAQGRAKPARGAEGLRRRGPRAAAKATDASASAKATAAERPRRSAGGLRRVRPPSARSRPRATRRRSRSAATAAPPTPAPRSGRLAGAGARCCAACSAACRSDPAPTPAGVRASATSAAERNEFGPRAVGLRNQPSPGVSFTHRGGGTTADPAGPAGANHGHLAGSAVVRREPVSSPRRRPNETTAEIRSRTSTRAARSSRLWPRCPARCGARGRADRRHRGRLGSVLSASPALVGGQMTLSGHARRRCTAGSSRSRFVRPTAMAPRRDAGHGCRGRVQRRSWPATQPGSYTARAVPASAALAAALAAVADDARHGLPPRDRDLVRPLRPSRRLRRSPAAPHDRRRPPHAAVRHRASG